MTMCDDCVADPCQCDPGAKWITERIRAGGGDVTFFLTANGGIGVLYWNDTNEKQWHYGDSAEEVIAKAMHPRTTSGPGR